MAPFQFNTILADPPWPYNSWTAVGVPTRKLVARGMAPAHYPVMSFEQMAELPVASFASKNCSLFMWATWPRMPMALQLGKAWGFKYSTVAFVWVKLSPKSRRFEEIKAELTLDLARTYTAKEVLAMLPKFHFGLGYWTRANTEFCLLFTKGSPKRQDNAVFQVIHAPLGRHSEKPQDQYPAIERLVEGPYLELFARKAERVNWSFWGNEIKEPDIEMES
jgi:N6-adenosine-specific RNA methylase IME4